MSPGQGISFCVLEQGDLLARVCKLVPVEGDGGGGNWDRVAILGGSIKLVRVSLTYWSRWITQTAPFTVIKKETKKLKIRGKKQQHTGFFDFLLVSTSCNFDFGLCDGWEQSDSDVFDWTLKTGSTGSTDTGPDYDHTSGSGKSLVLCFCLIKK